jgi:hypothetical protein
MKQYNADQTSAKTCEAIKDCQDLSNNNFSEIVIYQNEEKAF